MMIAPFLVVPVAAALLWKHAHVQPGVRPVQRRAHLVSDLRRDAPPQPTGSPSSPAARDQVALIWQWTPFMMLILLAGLQSRPGDVIEAAQVDGANAVADLPQHDAAAHAPLPRARRPARRDLHHPALRLGLHDHRRRPRHREPAVHDLPDPLQRPGLRPGLGPGRDRRDRHDHRRDLRPAHRVQPVRGGERR